jgi:hypothetical protein
MAFTGVANSNTRLDSLRMDGPIYSKATTGVVAFAGGGQASATPLPSDINVVSTVATAADSVQLPTAEAGREVTVINATANAAAVFPAVGDKINALSANASFSVAAGKSATFIGAAAGQWFCLLSA